MSELEGLQGAPEGQDRPLDAPAGVARPGMVSPPAPVGRATPTTPHRSPTVCPFLRGPDGLPPVDGGHGPNRCATFGQPLVQSARQEELVCRTAAHRACPRYLRGASLADRPVPLASSRVPRGTVAATAVLVLAIGGTIAFSMARGGLDLAAAPSPGATQVATSPSSAPGTGPAPSPSVATPAPSATFAPASSAPASSPAASSPPTEAPASISPLLVACPDRPACYLYRVQPGDNLAGIAAKFGVSYLAVRRMNPELTDATIIHVGEQIALPPPTR